MPLGSQSRSSSFLLPGRFTADDSLLPERIFFWNFSLTEYFHKSYSLGFQLPWSHKLALRNLCTALCRIKNNLIVPTVFCLLLQFCLRNSTRAQRAFWPPIAMISASKLHFEESKCISELHFFGLLHRVSFKGQPQKCAEVYWDVQPFVNSLGSVDVQDNTSRLLSQNMKAACPRSQIGSHNIIRNQQSLFSFLLSGLDLEHVLYNQTKENNIV